MPTLTYVGKTVINDGDTTVVLPVGTLVGDLIMVGIRAGAGFGVHTADITDARLTSHTESFDFGSTWPELFTVGWGYATTLSNVTVNVSALDGNSFGMLAVYRVDSSYSGRYSSGNGHLDPTDQAIPALATGPQNLVIFVTADGSGISYTDTAVWTEDDHVSHTVAAFSAVTEPPTDSLHVQTAAFTELTRWLALSLGVDDSVIRNLVINPSAEQNFDRAWVASNGTIETNVDWEV